MKRSKMLVIAVLIIAIVSANCNVTTAQAATSSTTSSFVQMLYKKYFGKVMPTATPKPTATPIPTATSTPKPTATSTPVPTATSTPKPTATSTPVPTATSTPKPTATSTPVPTATSTPVPTATSTPVPTATSTPVPTATSTPVPTVIVYDKTSVKYYGAVGDGITDDTAAFNKALTANQGGKIYIPSGTYIISNSIRIYANTTIYGDGATSIIMAADGMPVGSTMLYAWYANNIAFDNFEISGNSAVNTRADGYNDQDGIHLLDIWYCDNVNITNCSFVDNIYVAIRTIGVNNVNVLNNIFSNVDCGFSTLGSTDFNNIVVSGNSFTGHDYSEAVSFYATAHHDNITVTNNTISNKIHGIGIHFSMFGTHSNILVENNTITATAVGIHIQNVTNGYIRNNKVSNTTCGNGISATYVENVEISGNIITDIQFDAFRIEASNSVTLSNNIISGYSLYNWDFVGVRIVGSCSSLLINSNSILKTDSSLSSRGIYIDAYGAINIANNNLTSCKIYLEYISTGVNVNTTSSLFVTDAGTGNVLSFIE